MNQADDAAQLAASASSTAAKKSKYMTAPPPIETMPKGIPYIIGNEAAERFSFYGMRTILVIFMTRYLHYMVDGEVGTELSKAAANEQYHEFVAYTYFFPVLGSFLSDIFLGKYYTILWLSIVYCLGHLALALMGGAGLEPATWLAVGLFLIAFGSGGIKPCVSAHVGDQFGTKNTHLMSRVFQWFYFSINLGSTISTILTPLLLKWYGPHVAFGVPGILMALATLVFWMGRNVFVHVPPGGMAFFKETFSKDGVSALLKLSIIYAFVAVFWSLFDQTGSSWVLQAENMDRKFLGVTWLESQIQAINPILVMILIPLFQFLIYPAVNKVFKLTPIRKISIGLFFATAGFWLIALAQDLIDKGEVPSIAWQLYAYLLLTSAEIMISITGLEFSYTQAPKKMKSVVMAVWLFSVSLGNIFASGVNHFIQVPGINQIADEVKVLDPGSESTIKTWRVKTLERPEEDSEKPGKKVQVSGVDDTFDTVDDVVMLFNSFNQLKEVETSENEILKSASRRIEKAFFESTESANEGNLPSDEQGQELIADLLDSAGKALVYRQLSRNDYRISAAGADAEPGTQWDVILKAKVSRVDTSKDSSTQQNAPYHWLEKRIIEIRGEEGKEEVKRKRGEIAETKIDFEITVGGQDTLEGAAYFDFWTYTVLITAILFIPVGYFYKEKSYIQNGDSDSREG
ncbi:MAG: POT family MFS transporter [Pirellulales bacterium]|nr:POT family MFS transporter [Pirellulales bacterium]